MPSSVPTVIHHAATRSARGRLASPVAAAAVALVALGLPTLVTGSASVVFAPTAPVVQPVVPQLPTVTGPHRVGTVPIHLVDRSRPDPLVPAKPVRELMVQLWYPIAHHRGCRLAAYLPPAAARELAAGTGLPLETLAAVRTSGHECAPLRGRGRHPVVLYSPGLGVPRAFGTTVVQDLASHGFLVVAIDHTYDAAVVEFPGGRVEHGISPDPQPALRARVDDVRFVLAELARLDAGRLAAGFRHRLDLARVAMFGHSLGGATAANAIVAGMPIRAGLNMDGGIWSPASDPGVRIRRPFLQFGSEQHSRYTDPTWAQFWTNLHGWRRELQIDGTLHLDFTDLGLLLDQLGVDKNAVFPGSFGPIQPARAIDIQQTYVRAFFGQHVRGRHHRLLDRPSRQFPEVIFNDGNAPPMAAPLRTRSHLDDSRTWLTGGSP
jgi:dienelactone hydrolase